MWAFNSEIYNFNVTKKEVICIYIMSYYMEESVSLGTKLLVDSIRHFIRDPSGVFSVFQLCECRIVQWRHDSHLLLLLNWFLASRSLFRIKAWRTGLRPSATKKLKSLQKNLKTRTRRRKPCPTEKFSKNILRPVTRKGKLKILRPWNCKKRNWKSLFLMIQVKVSNFFSIYV